MNTELNQLYEQRRKIFEEKYEEAFGKKCVLKPLNIDEEKVVNGEYIMALNCYGIKSNWL